MALRIIENGCRMDGGKLIITIEGDNPEQVLSQEGKTLALTKAATYGYTRIGINGSSGSYPVDAEGNMHEDWGEQAKQNLIAAYRNEIILMQGI